MNGGEIIKSISEVSILSGVSVRTLHYYHELELLIPTKITEHGYRLYDVNAIIKLQTILLLKELGFSLKEIKLIINNATNDTNLFDEQRKLLIQKRDRINELIELLEKLKRGEAKMNFKEYTTEQIDLSFQEMLDAFSAEERQEYLDKMGGKTNAREIFEKTFIENQAALDRYIVDDEDIEKLSDVSVPEKSVAEKHQKKCQDKINALNCSLSKLITGDYKSDQVQQIVSELESAHKELFSMNNVLSLFADLGKLYLENEGAISAYDNLYGKGFSHFWGNAVIYYCQCKESEL